MTVESSPASAPPAPARTNKPDHQESNVKETIESILVAFILAFIFRAFIVEAFVIPTGSMAPTLLGAHMRFTCGDCGYGFQTNYGPRDTDVDDNPIIPARSGPVRERDPDTGRIVVRNTTHNVYGPNGGYKVPPRAATNVDVHYGDRILVLKYLYLFQDPKRWDVVVFKSPSERGTGDALTPRYSANYIKRLVGRPGESVLILDGDIYVGAHGQEPETFQIQRLEE